MEHRISPIFVARTASPVSAEIDRLTNLYRKQFKRAIPVELFFAIWGDVKKPEYGISLLWEDTAEENAAAEWVQFNVGAEEALTSTN